MRKRQKYDNVSQIIGYQEALRSFSTSKTIMQISEEILSKKEEFSVRLRWFIENSPEITISQRKFLQIFIN